MQTKVSEDFSDGIIYVSAASCIAMIFMAGNAIAFAMVSAFLATCGTVYLFYKSRNNRLGRRLWNFMMRHGTIADVTLTVGFAFLFGTTTATGLLAGAAAGVMTSALFNLIKKVLPDEGVLPEYGQQDIKHLTNANMEVINAAA